MAREKVFQFKQFSVLNDKTAMKVGTDGVLIGAWCDVMGAKRVLDVGTGCGLIALMVAQRASDAAVHAIDIDGDSISEARYNFENSPWSNRLSAELIDFNDFQTSFPFDLIVSNPPFFDNGVLPPSKGRNMARHNSTLTFEQLIACSIRLLTHNGILSLIAPANAVPSIRSIMVANGLWLKRVTSVIPVVGEAPKRVMLEMSKAECGTVEDSITIHDVDHHYTEQYQLLTKHFYLKM